MHEETPVMLEQIVNILERHTKSLEELHEANRSGFIQYLDIVQSLRELKEKVEKLGANDALAPKDNNLVASINAIGKYFNHPSTKGLRVSKWKIST